MKILWVWKSDCFRPRILLVALYLLCNCNETAVSGLDLKVTKNDEGKSLILIAEELKERLSKGIS